MAGDDAVVLDVAIDRRERLWAIRHAIPDALRAAGQVVACDIASAPNMASVPAMPAIITASFLLPSAAFPAPSSGCSPQ